ncbi:PLP-dependent aminotransferase family protein [Vagococcus carniphilus]|uniref:PLP-dependent aminotransferase family protein n=1 Tax=Vagococcus carniphilus TaxID=218144 RepID=A0AAW8U0J0_9ENTE|nr:PLP-dependent aminotransferase family protein [Vagococcus carniphilus]MDT2833060.1 PLP-dependent aminotransferase family protein [Vagococcus carniphilus]
MTVYSKIKCDIQNDHYQEGEKIPSLRNLASIHQCSLETIKKALHLLIEENLLYSKDRSGYYVLQKAHTMPEISKNGVIDFTSSKANCITFPYSEFQWCLKKATENYKEEFFRYGKSQGLPELIQTLQSWFSTQQLYVKKENLFITTGIQQALFILSRLTFPNKKNQILIEMPTYHLMLDLLKLENLPFLTIDRNAQGIDWEKLEFYFKEHSIKFFYTTTRLSSPLGLSYSESEKKKLVQLAQKYEVYIIEDDYLADYVTDSTNQPLHFYDTSEHVIYLKSFSKIMFPGLRIGACLLPSQLVSSFQQYRALLEIDSAMFSQAALNLYIKSGLFDQHIKQTQLLQEKRNQAFIEVSQNYQDLKLFNTDSFKSSKAFLTLPSIISPSSFEKELINQQVKLDDMNRHFLDNTSIKQNVYGLELFNVNTEQIETGLAKIVDVYESIQNK